MENCNFKEELEFYDDYSNKISEEIEELKNLNDSESVEILEEVIFQNLGFYMINESINDKHGGNVQTRQNIQKGVYANEENRYKREEYEDKKKMNDYKEKQRDQEGNITCEITGKKSDNIHTDHIVSAKEFHTDYGFAEKSEDKKNFINSEDNYAAINGPLNQSKSDQALEDWKENKQGKRKIENKEHFGYDEDVAKKVEEKDKKKRQQMDEKRNKVLGKYYTKESVSQGLKKGGNMALKIAINEVFAITTKELLLTIKEDSNSKSNLKNFIKSVGKSLKNALVNIFKSLKDIFKKVIKALANGLLETIITTIINIFFTTAYGIIKGIRSVINMIFNAKNSYEKISSGNKKHRKKEIVSLIMNGVLTLPIFGGFGIVSKVEEMILSIGIPNLLSDALAMGLCSLLGGILVIILSTLVKKLADSSKEKIMNNLSLLNNGLKADLEYAKTIVAHIELENVVNKSIHLITKISRDSKKQIEEINDNLLYSQINLENLEMISIVEKFDNDIQRKFIAPTNHNENMKKLIESMEL